MTNRIISVIVKDQNPLMLRVSDTVKHACECMHERRVGAVLVVDKNRKLQGIFTGRDVVRVMASHPAPAKSALADVMTAAPDTIRCDCTAIEALRAMGDGGYRHLPVLDADGKVLGIVSRSDFKGLELDRFEDELNLWERIC